MHRMIRDWKAYAGLKRQTKYWRNLARRSFFDRFRAGEQLGMQERLLPSLCCPFLVMLWRVGGRSSPFRSHMGWELRVGFQCYVVPLDERHRPMKTPIPLL